MSNITADAAIVDRVALPDGNHVVIEAIDAYDETEIHAHCQNCDRPVGSCGYGPNTRYDFTGALNTVKAAAKRHAKACGTDREATS